MFALAMTKRCTKYAHVVPSIDLRITSQQPGQERVEKVHMLLITSISNPETAPLLRTIRFPVALTGIAVGNGNRMRDI